MALTQTLKALLAATYLAAAPGDVKSQPMAGPVDDDLLAPLTPQAPAAEDKPLLLESLEREANANSAKMKGIAKNARLNQKNDAIIIDNLPLRGAEFRLKHNLKTGVSSLVEVTNGKEKSASLLSGYRTRIVDGSIQVTSPPKEKLPSPAHREFLQNIINEMPSEDRAKIVAALSPKAPAPPKVEKPAVSTDDDLLAPLTPVKGRAKAKSNAANQPVVKAEPAPAVTYETFSDLMGTAVNNQKVMQGLSRGAFVTYAGAGKSQVATGIIIPNVPVKQDKGPNTVPDAHIGIDGTLSLVGRDGTVVQSYSGLDLKINKDRKGKYSADVKVDGDQVSADFLKKFLNNRPQQDLAQIAQAQERSEKELVAKAKATATPVPVAEPKNPTEYSSLEQIIKEGMQNPDFRERVLKNAVVEVGANGETHVRLPGVYVDPKVVENGQGSVLSTIADKVAQTGILDVRQPVARLVGEKPDAAAVKAAQELKTGTLHIVTEGDKIKLSLTADTGGLGKDFEVQSATTQRTLNPSESQKPVLGFVQEVSKALKAGKPEVVEAIPVNDPAVIAIENRSLREKGKEMLSKLSAGASLPDAGLKRILETATANPDSRYAGMATTVSFKVAGFQVPSIIDSKVKSPKMEGATVVLDMQTGEARVMNSAGQTIAELPNTPTLTTDSKGVVTAGKSINEGLMQSVAKAMTQSGQPTANDPLLKFRAGEVHTLAIKHANRLETIGYNLAGRPITLEPVKEGTKFFVLGRNTGTATEITATNGTKGATFEANDPVKMGGSNANDRVTEFHKLAKGVGTEAPREQRKAQLAHAGAH